MGNKLHLLIIVIVLCLLTSVSYASVVYHDPENGICGNSNGALFTAAPETELCSKGTASNITGTGPWNWTCDGLYGGNPSPICTANIQAYAITFLSGGNGTLTGTANQTINYGASASAVTAVPATGYHFLNWTGTGGFVTTTANPLTVNNVIAAQTITANFTINQYTVNAMPGTNGTLDATTPTQINVNHGATTSFKFNAANGYYVSSASGCGGTPYTNSDQSVTTYTYTTGAITGVCTANANFAIKTYAIIFQTDGNGTLTGTINQTINHGSSTTQVTANANSGFQFVNWSGTGGFVTTTTNPLTVSNVTAALTITANFSASPINGACGSSNNGTFTIAPNSNLCSAGNPSGITGSGPWTWTCAGANGGSNSLTCSANIQNYAIIFTSGGNGTLTGTESQMISHGSSTTQVTANPTTGYHFVNWTGTNGFISTTSNPLIVNNIVSAQTITANFAANPINGTCGTSSGASFANPPAANLCSNGTASDVSTTATGWEWSCNGLYGGTNVTCSANKQAISSKPGDCDASSTVSIAEVQSAINMFLGVKTSEFCVDQDGVGGVTISEVQKVINGFLGL